MIVYFGTGSTALHLVIILTLVAFLINLAILHRARTVIKRTNDLFRQILLLGFETHFHNPGETSKDRDSQDKAASDSSGKAA